MTMTAPSVEHHLHYQPGQCILQVLLVSPPPYNATPAEPLYSKPFAPWKPGDAYSVESDWSDWRLLLGSIDEGDQTRYGVVIF